MKTSMENPLLVFWLQQTEADVPQSDAWLCAPEALVLGRLRFAKRRWDWRLGRWTAKRALAAYLGCPPENGLLSQIEVRASPSGAPEFFIGGERSPIAVSLSHRAGAALSALAPSGRALGCDLELVEPRAAAFVEDYFTGAERAFLARASSRHLPALVTLLWSAKESALKAMQQGLRLDTRAVAVTAVEQGSVPGEDDGLTSQHGWQALSVRFGDARVFYGWWQRAGEVVRTVVAERPMLAPVVLASSFCDWSAHHTDGCWRGRVA